MRSRKYRLVTTAERLNNRLMRVALRAGFAPRAFALLETTGRASGLPRQTPVANGVSGDSLLPDDDPAARSRTLRYQWDAAIGRLMTSSPLTIRIDLDRFPAGDKCANHT